MNGITEAYQFLINPFFNVSAKMFVTICSISWDISESHQRVFLIVQTGPEIYTSVIKLNCHLMYCQLSLNTENKNLKGKKIKLLYGIQ